MRLILLPALLLAGCPTQTECGPAECAAICDAAASVAPTDAPAPEPTGGTRLSEYEAELVAPILEDVRAGVRPFDEEGIGICRGKRECEEYLGMEVGELPPGEYMLQADVRVPRSGEGWKVELTTECETVRTTASGESRTTSDYSRSYDVRYAGEQRGYRLRPLRTIQSPNPGGAQSCTWTITAPHPSGDKVYSGSWSVPAAE